MDAYPNGATIYFTTENDYYEGGDPNQVFHHFGEKPNHTIFSTKLKSCGQEQGTEYFLTDNDYYFEGADDDVDESGDQ